MAFTVKGKRVLVVGDAEEAEQRARVLVGEGAMVSVVPSRVTPGLQELERGSQIKLIPRRLAEAPSLLQRIRPKPYLIMVSSQDDELNKRVAAAAKRRKILTYVEDAPILNDFNMPAIARFGEVVIGVFTGGRSPLMAHLIKERLIRMKVVTEEDILQLRLQEYARKFVKQLLPDKESRRTALYRIIRDSNVTNLLRQRRFKEAQEITKQLIEELSRGSVRPLHHVSRA